MKLGHVMGGFATGIPAGMRIADSLEESRLKKRLAEAADVKPETIETVGDYTGTMGLTGADEQARMLQEQDAAFGADGARATAEALNSNIADTTPASGMVKTTHRMGGVEQDRPFRPEQIQAEAMNRQAGVHLAAGNAKEAVGLYGLAKQRTRDAMLSSADEATRTGMKTVAQNASAQEKEFKRLNSRYEALVNSGLYDEASSVFGQMEKAREGFIKHSRDRADAQMSATGKLDGHVNNFNNFFANGQTITRYQQNPDGSLSVFEVNGKELDQPRTFTKDDLLGSADDAGGYKPGWIERMYDPGTHREFATKYMQAGALKRQESKIAEAAPSKMASADKDKATAEYYRGAKTLATNAQAEAARARAEGSGSNLGQQRFDEKQFGAFIRENSSLYELPDSMNEGKYVTNRVARDTFAAAARRNPELAQRTFAQMRYAAEADATDSDGNVDPQKMNAAYIKRVNEFAKRLVAPPSAQPQPQPGAPQPSQGMARQPAPQPPAALPEAAPAQAERFNEAGYRDTASTIDGARRGDRGALRLLREMYDTGGLSLSEKARVRELIGGR